MARKMVRGRRNSKHKYNRQKEGANEVAGVMKGPQNPYNVVLPTSQAILYSLTGHDVRK